MAGDAGEVRRSIGGDTEEDTGEGMWKMTSWEPQLERPPWEEALLAVAGTA